MKTITITRLKIVLVTAAWLAAFVILELSHFYAFEILNIIGFLSLAILPGLLTTIAIEIKGLPFWGHLILAVGFSLLELMLVALIGNTILPLFGIARPLDKSYLLFELCLLLPCLLAAVWIRIKDVTITISGDALKHSRDGLLAFAPALFVVLAIFGAIRLNDGGSGFLTMLMLASMAIYIGVLLYFSEQVEENTIPTALFFIASALLLMTSLRGWYVTGHDIQHETEVFELAKNTGIWSIAAFRNPYNACLSITILPTIFANLLHVADQYIFKIFYQIFFALCAVLVYLIGRQWTTKRVALLGSIYFVAFPTFFTDMPFINRQEIAFIYFGLMIYLIFEKSLSLALRRALFMVLGVGVIISHYSTTYTVLVIFGLAAISRPLFLKLLPYIQKKTPFKSSALVVSAVKGDQKITILMVVILLALSFLWTSIITNTGSNVTDVITQTLAAIPEGFGGANRSIDATSLLTFSNPSLNVQLQLYITNVINPIRTEGFPGEYYPTNTYSQYPIQALNNIYLPLSSLGRFFDASHIDITIIMPYIGQLFSKLAELFIPVGTLYLLFRKRIVNYIDDELYLIALYSLVFVALNLILPVLSVDYGVFRAIQQGLFIIAPILVIGSIAIGIWIATLSEILIKRIKPNSLEPAQLNIQKLAYNFASYFAIGFFLYSTSFIPQLFGGNAAALHLNNSGQYYDYFLTKTQEVYAINWLARIPQENPAALNQIQFEVESDRFASSKLASVANIPTSDDIIPEIVRRNAYVFLSVSNVVEHIASEFYDGDRIAYTYPTQFLDENKNLVYNNGGSRIYR
jgi:uncharacterized membrane protein